MEEYNNMPRERKDSRPFNINLATPLWDKVNEYNAHTGIPKTVIVEKALEEYFSKREKEDLNK